MRHLPALLLALCAALSVPALADTDILGRTVPENDGRPTVVLYVNRDSRKKLKREAFDLVWALREQQPKVVVRVDLSDVPGFLHGLAKGQVRDAWKDSLRDMAAVFRSHGEAPESPLDRSLFMVADDDGQPHRAIGLRKKFREPWAQVLDGDGHPVGQGPFPAASAELQAALVSADDAETEKAPASEWTAGEASAGPRAGAR